MEQVFFVKNGDLQEVNKVLGEKRRIKSIHPVAENISSYGCAGDETGKYNHGYNVGNVYAYVVIEYN